MVNSGAIGRMDDRAALAKPLKCHDFGRRQRICFSAPGHEKETVMRVAAGLALALGIGLASGTAQAQDAWPTRPITFIVPYGAGGYTDLVARVTARYVEKALGKPVVIDNRAAAGGIVGTQAVANAVPDG